MSLIEQIFSITFVPVAMVLLPLVLGFLTGLVIVIIVYKCIKTSYMKTEYYFATSKPFGALRRDRGAYGEYLIYKQLSKLDGNKRFLFNCYVPKDDGSTSEIDVILLHTSGIFVFESKNLSGWVFGTESQKTWTQTFPTGRKEKFYNPIMQNNTHIKWLKRTIPEIDEKAFHSIIVFSARCELKKVTLTTDQNKVIKRNYLLSTVAGFASQNTLADGEIETLYRKLFPLTQTTEDTRIAHIHAINNRGNRIQQQISANTTASIEICSTSDSESSQTNSIITCAKCGSNMVLRTASRGERKGQQFYGCSLFPKCKQTEDIGGFDNG